MDPDPKAGYWSVPSGFAGLCLVLGMQLQVFSTWCYMESGS